MKKFSILLLAFVCLNVTSLFAQDGAYVEVMRSVLSAEKKAVVADVMAFSDEESTIFWPLYNEYQQKLYDINTKRYNLIMDFAKNFESMSDEKAAEVMKAYLDYDASENKLRKSYLPKFEKAIGNIKTLRYYQTENKIKALVDYELAAEIPLLEK